MLIILCTDNTGVAAPNKESINSLVSELQDEGFNLEMEGNFTEHPGIGIKHRGDRTINMTQKGPINKIIATAKMKECKPNKTPALTTAPGSDNEGEPWDQNCWDCACQHCRNVVVCVKRRQTRHHVCGESSCLTRCTSKRITSQSSQVHPASSHRNCRQRNHCKA